MDWPVLGPRRAALAPADVRPRRAFRRPFTRSAASEFTLRAGRTLLAMDQ